MASSPQHDCITTTWLHYYNMASLLQHGFITTTWLHYHNMTSLPQHDCITTTWLHYHNMALLPQHDCITTTWLHHHNMTSIPQWTDSQSSVNHDHLKQYIVNLNPIDYDYIVRWQSDLENTQEKSLLKPSQDQRKSTELGGAWNFAEQCIWLQFFYNLS